MKKERDFAIIRRLCGEFILDKKMCVNIYNYTDDEDFEKISVTFLRNGILKYQFIEFKMFSWCLIDILKNLIRKGDIKK